ncbi:MAG: alpha/beta hydrolase [Edaphobacter sp.]|uniref:alpha/beta hydrolase n=1 Tax=Edaphobacter sp. TaxID=1934404 RepID=UPI0023A78698|nr:alpha/beta hydrolase [Edaphobacter sp.]MDE1175608.1 alpha/beta hydrolase [Edaphobacter sp.]
MSFASSMKKRWPLLTAIALCLLTFAAMPARSAAQLSASQMETKGAARRAKARNILLVHGAWSDGSSFEKVIPLLQDEGFHVVSVQIPLTSFSDDVATTRRALALEDGPVLLVGHSYGGAVITEVGNDPKVVGLVYLAALAPEVGESTSSLLNSVSATPLFSELSQDAHGFLKVSEKGYLADFVEGIPEKEQRILAATQEPTNAASLGGTVTVASWKEKPSWYIVTETDRAVATELQRFMSKRISASTISVRSCHVVMFSHPEVVASVVTLAALGFHW